MFLKPSPATMRTEAPMAPRVAALSLPLAVLFVIPPGFSLAQPDPDLERAARIRFESGVQFLNGGRGEQALRDFEAVLQTMGESSFADDAALEIARYRFEVEGDAGASRAMLERLLAEYPAGDVVPGAYFLKARMAREATPPRLSEAQADWERAVLAGGADSPWSYPALVAIARLDFAFMRDDEAAGALLEALYGSHRGDTSPGDLFEAQFLLGRALARSGDREAALLALGALRRDILEAGDEDAFDLADRAFALGDLIASGGDRGFLGGIVAPRPLDRPLRLRVSGSVMHILDRDTGELQSLNLEGESIGVLPVENARSFAMLPDGGPVIAAERALLLDGRMVRMLAPDDEGRLVPLDRIRSVAVTPEGLWIWDERREQILRFAFSGVFVDVMPLPRLADLRLIERHPAGYLLVLGEGGVRGFDPVGNSVLSLPLEDPVDVAFDDLGRLHVLDAEGPLIVTYDRDFRQISRISAADLRSAGIREPVSLDIGTDGSLFVLDAGGVIGVFR